MLRNYFTIAWRSLINNKLRTLLNIVGLSVGISSCLVIYLIVSHELSFNRRITDGDKIYRIYTQFTGAFIGTNSGVCTGIQAMAKSQFTGIEHAVSFFTYEAKVTIPDNVKKDFEKQSGQVIVGPDYFELIKDYQWVVGDSHSSLSKPFQVVLTEARAKLYFGFDDPSKAIGKEIHYQDSLHLFVSGIVKPLPYVTDLIFAEFISASTIEKSFLQDSGMQPNDWESTSGNSQLFVKLEEGATEQNLENQLTLANAKATAMNKDGSFKAGYKSQPLSELHFNTELGVFDGGGQPANKSTLTILITVAALLLIIAAINFINLETAQAATRAREVGVRKVLGSTRGQLIYHFLAQSILITTLATLLSLPISEFALLFFSDFIPTGVTLSLAQGSTILFVLGVIFVVGILSGSYPAFFMSSFLPALALKNKAYVASAQTRTAFLRKGLIVFQFSTAQVLIIATMVVISQINFLLRKDLGFNKEAIIHFRAPYYEEPGKLSVLKGELENVPEIEKISLSTSPPSSESTMSRIMIYKSNEGEQKTNVYRKIGDENYIPLYGLKIIAGRNLLPSDSLQQIVVNETYLKELNLKPEEAIGKEVWGGTKPYSIVGIVRDFNTMSLHTGYQPVMLSKGQFNYAFNLKLHKASMNNLKSPLTKIETAWKKVFPSEKFEYSFMDETIRNFYETEQKMSKIASTAMIIAIIICCLGLFGLASYTSIQRSKEIGIRKVLGATVDNIVVLLSSDFLKLVLVAFAIAAPIAYYGANKFLSDYAFHTKLGWQLFALAGIASIVLAFITVSYQAIKAAITNPVESLKNE